MRIERLASIFAIKYNLYSLAATKDVMNDIMRDLIDAYNNYININKVKPAFNILPLLAQRGEPFSNSIIEKMTEIKDNITVFTATDLFIKIKELLELIANLSEDNHKAVRNSIESSWKVSRVPDRNDMNRAKSKFEQVVFKKLNSILKEQATKLKNLIATSDQISNKEMDIIPQELTQQDIWMFRKTPSSQKYRLDDDEVWTKIWEDPDMKKKISKLIRSIKRGNIPLDGSEVAAATYELMATRIEDSHKYQRQMGENELDPEEIKALEQSKLRKEKLQELKDKAFADRLEKEEAERQELSRIKEDEKNTDFNKRRLLNLYGNLSFEKWVKRGTL